jgi:ABC-type molybdenum transport system ATPase subunit/photorepair protein PhrA
VSSLLEELNKARVRMPREYLEIALEWVNRAKSELRRAMSMLSSEASAQQVNAAATIIQQVSSGLQYAVSLVAPYQATDPDAAKLVIELQQIQAMLQELQQRISAIMLRLSLRG